MKILTSAILGVAVSVAAAAQADEIKLPSLLSWTGYDTGTSGLNQAVAIGGAIPSALFYFALLAQIDAYAARNGLKGLKRIAVHLFILYWGMVSYITPPVALGAFAAASLAGTSPLRAGFEAMRQGSVIYALPFLFVLNPALIGSAGTAEIARAVACAFSGVALTSMGLQGYVTFVGTLAGRGQYPLRGLLTLGGFSLALPAMPFLGIGDGVTAAIGLALAALPVAVAYRRGLPAPTAARV